MSKIALSAGKIINTLGVGIIALFFVLAILPGKVFSQQLDTVSFMKADFNVNGYTPFNSYLAQTSHQYDKANAKWNHIVESQDCPPSLPSCLYTNWRARYMTRQKPGENILYLNKGAATQGKGIESFFYNNESVYDFQESWFRDANDLWSQSVFGVFHNLSHLPQTNPNLGFPNRGQFWAKRFFSPNEETGLINQIQINEYVNMKLTVGAKSGNMFPFSYKVRHKYYPNWNSSLEAWNGLPDVGNLPTPLDVVCVEHLFYDGSQNLKMVEKYYYGKSGQNSFGLIRFELWDPKLDVCGSNACCTTAGGCDASYPLTLRMQNVFNQLSYYGTGENPDAYFAPWFYADPKIEKYPGEPTNGALSRGKFKLLNSNQWVQIVSVLTDGDWLISAPISSTQLCPDGYTQFGAIATNFIDHREVDQGYGWANFCGTNANVLLAVSCPVHYESRFVISTNLPLTSAYDYKNTAVGGSNLNYCVHYNETHWPKLPVPFSVSGLRWAIRWFSSIEGYNRLVSGFGK